MTKNDFEEILKDMGYKLHKRMGGDYWIKKNKPTYLVAIQSVKRLTENKNIRYELEPEQAEVTGDNG